ncbi:MAG: flagellar M-ring protein FliF [Lachnospira sp.]|nr:flagellar M-ring protein FliF [Lachnospira sp.]
MAERLKQLLDRVVEVWKNWTAKQRAMFVSVVAGVLVAVAILGYALSRPNYEVLATCDDYTEINSITDILTDEGIASVVDDDRMVVKVKKKDLTTAKMAIAEGDFKSDGYSLEDALNSSFTTTESDRNRRYELYLETKFKKDLESMDGVKKATVTVSLTEDNNSFYATTDETSVSVMLTTNKVFDDEAAESMAVFLATAVGNDTTNNIDIITTDGATLFSGRANSSGGSGISSTGKMKYKNQIESTTVSALSKGILATGFYDEIHANLNYNLDWDVVNQVATEYTTQGGEQAIFGESYEEVSESTDGSGGTPGTSSNDDDTTYDITDGYGGHSTIEIKEYKYLPNSLVTTTIKEPGQIIFDDSTLAVTLIDKMIYREEECEKLGYLEEMTWDEFRSQNSEDTILEVDDQWIEILSKATGVDPENIAVMAVRRNYFEAKETTSIFSNPTMWFQLGLAAIILLLLLFVVLRSARPLTVEEKEPELSIEEMLSSTRENQPTVEDIDMNDKSETRKAIEKFVEENPEAVALLLRNWLNEGWS